LLEVIKFPFLSNNSKAYNNPVDIIILQKKIRNVPLKYQRPIFWKVKFSNYFKANLKTNSISQSKADLTYCFDIIVWLLILSKCAKIVAFS